MEILDPQPQPQQPQRRSREISTGTIVTGIIFVIVGLVLLVDNTGWISFKWRQLFLSWQMLLIIVGVVSIAKRQVSQGLIFLGLGILFYLPRIGNIFHLDGWWYTYNWHNLWPLALIAIGLIIVVRARSEKFQNRGNDTGTFGANGKRFTVDAETSPDGYIHFEYLFNGSEQVFLEPVFRGGSIEAVFGGATLDLRRTSIPEGTSTLRIKTVFGGVTLMIPEDWNVEIRSHCIFGGFSDKRYLPNTPVSSTKKLVLEVECIFGGGEIK